MIERNYKKGVGYKVGLDNDRILELFQLILLLRSSKFTKYLYIISNDLVDSCQFFYSNMLT